MPLELHEDEMGDPRNAHFLAVASELAYMPEGTGTAAFAEQLGLTAQLISVGHSQCWAGANDGNVVLAFRGTESPTSLDGLKDWLLADAMNLLILPEGRLGTDFAAAGVDARFHKGFLDALASVWDPVFEFADTEIKRKERPLWLTGHSLGGAMALLAAWLFKRKFVAVHQVYTFGAPMVANKVGSAAFDAAFPDRIYRYVNLTDPVPLLPTLSLAANDYAHCQKSMELGGGEAGGLGAKFRDLAGGAVDGVLSGALINDFWAGITQRIAAHGLDKYRQGLKDRFGI